MVHQESPKNPYHHGDLRRAILDVAEGRLNAGGPQSVTLRACAKEAGVSHAAPLHHFGSLRGLNSAIAARGFERLVSRLDAEVMAKDASQQESSLIGAYVDFAVSAPHMFDLMWRDEALDSADEALVQARRRFLDRLVQISAGNPDPCGATLTSIRVWSLSHVLATLLQHGRIVTCLSNKEINLTTARDFAALAYRAEFLTNQSD